MRHLAAVVVLSCWPFLAAAAKPAAAPAAEPPATAAFNPGTGALDVDRAGYLSRHDVVYNSPQPDPAKGLTVGNGRTGATVWDADGLTMRVGGVDLAEQSAYAAGQLHIGTEPALGAGASSYRQRLSLYDGTLTTTWDANRTVTVLGVPGSEALGVHIDDLRLDNGDRGATTVELSLWDPAGVGDTAGVPDIGTWRTVDAFADTGAAGFSRGRRDPAGYGYTFAATVEGAAYTTKVADDTHVRLTVTPARSYTIWFTAAARLGATGGDSVARARDELTAAARAGYLGTLDAYRGWWHDFWSRSFVQYDVPGDYLENLCHLGLYLIGAGGYGTNPLHAGNGVSGPPRDVSTASNGYRFEAQHAVYDPLLTTGHPEVYATQNALYTRNTAALQAGTKERYGTDGVWVPATMTWDGRARDPAGQPAGGTGPQVAYRMYLQYRYTGDLGYLRDTAYPFMRAVARFSGDAAGALLPALVDASERLGLDADLRAGWQRALGRPRPPVTAHPPAGGLHARDAVDAAEAGHGDDVVRDLTLTLRQHQTYPNGLTADPGEVYAWLGNHVAAVTESLLQSTGGRIRVFPAAPTGAGFTGRFTLLAEGGFQVSSERTGGDTEYVGLKSLSGNPARVVSPWAGQPLRVRRAADGATVATTSAEEVTFPTTAGAVYVVERVARPLSAYAPAMLTASRNDGMKTLPGTSVVLGTPGPGEAVLVNDTALTYDAGWVHTTGRGAGHLDDDTHDSTATGAAARYTFTGTGVEVLADTAGGADVTLDGVPQPAGANFSRGGLPDGAHTVRVVARDATPLRIDGLRIVTGALPGTAGPAGSSNLLAQADSRYVEAADGGAAPLLADLPAAGPATRFDVLDLGDGTVALRARIDGMYVCAENAGANPLVANRATVGAWETFTLVHNADGSVSLRAQVNGRYVTAESGGAAPLIANRTAIGSWERFTLVP